MPHPCALQPNLASCAEMELQHVAGEVPAETLPTVQEAIVTNAVVLTEHMNAALAKVGLWVESTENLVAEQMPLLVKEIIRFEIAEHGFWMLLGVLGILWGLYAYQWSYRNAEERLERIRQHEEALRAEARKRNRENPHLSDDVVFSFLHYAIPSSGGFTAFCGIWRVLDNLMKVLKPLVAPRLFLIEYFRQLAG